MHEIILSILVGTVRSGTPILLATQGGIITERSGVSNIGLEGLMLVGALSGFTFSMISGSPWIGALASCIITALFSLIHALLTVAFNVNQIISGMILNFLGTGLSSVIGASYVGKIAKGFKPIRLGPLHRIPYLGPALFGQDALVYLSLILSVCLTILIFKTRVGLSIRAVGDSAVSADSAGLSVRGVRVACIAAGGALCGLAGAYVSLAYTTMWQPEMTAGKGWIAVAMVIFAQWNPLKAIYSSYLFGGIMVLQLAFQVLGVNISPHLLQTLPYLMTIIALSIAMWRARGDGFSITASVGPASLAQPYIREGR